MFALIVGTLLSLLIPLLAFYFSSCAETQGPFEQTAATRGRISTGHGSEDRLVGVASVQGARRDHG